MVVGKDMGMGNKDTEGRMDMMGRDIVVGTEVDIDWDRMDLVQQEQETDSEEQIAQCSGELDCGLLVY